MIRPLLVATSFFALSGCGTLVTLGEPCTTRADCPPSNSCFLKAPSGTVEVPGGFCSTGCLSEGSTRECPGGTICTFFGDSNLICAPTCTTDAQCRAEYVCADLAMGSSAAGNMSGSKKSCRPKGVTR
jgi:hypothetical protein